MGNNPQGEDQGKDTAPSSAIGPEEVDSEALLGGSGQIRIRHAGQIYCLRRTGKGGLILTK